MISREADIQTAKLNGLVLAGGKSRRMGADKGAMQWHGKEQRYYVADLLQQFCSEAFISCRAEQEAEIDRHYHTIADSYEGKGPFGAILSAFKTQPDAAWLVIACDLPLLDADTIRYLLLHRDTSRMATTFKSPFDGLPEPLITVWEPAAYPVLLSYLSEGYSCPRKALIKSEDQVNILQPPDETALMNTNTPEDAEKVKTILQGR